MLYSADDYIDYDSDYEAKSGPVKDVDPYAGALAIFLVQYLMLTRCQVSSFPKIAERRLSKLKRNLKSPSFLK
jgi:hypothetical protein